MKKYLYEGLFDDIDDLMKDADDDLVTGDIKRLSEKNLLNILSNLISQYSFYLPYEKPTNNQIFMEKQNNIATFYYINGKNEKIYPRLKFYHRYIKNMLDTFNDFISSLIDCRITTVYNSIEINEYENESIDKIYDFKDIQFLNYRFENIYVKNIIADIDKSMPFINNHKLIGTDTIQDLTIYMRNTIIDDTLLIQDIDGIEFKNVQGINNFSFIKNINKRFSISYNKKTVLPKCNSLQGLPTGNYNIKVEYISLYYPDVFENIPIQSLKGIPDSVNHVTVDIQVKPDMFLQYFSFEGLTKTLLPKFDFTATRFPGTKFIRYVQLGKYLLEVKKLKWSPTKPQFEYIINAQDWFLDCYIKEPHKEYTPPVNIIQDEDSIKAEKQMNNIIKKKEEVKEDFNKMVDLFKSNIKKDDILYRKNNTIKIEDILINKFRYKYVSDYRTWAYAITYEDFVKQILKYEKDYGNPNKSDFKYYNPYCIDPAFKTTLYSIICEPVIKERKKIKDKEKKKEKLLKVKAKQTESKKQNITATPEPEKTETNNDIQIIDYSDRAIAVIGNTYRIKDQLKELNARFNKFLTIDGKKQAGWILPKSKQNKVEEII